MSKEIRIPHSELRDSRTCSARIEEAFQRVGLDAHRHEIDELYDDHQRGERVVKIQTPKKMVFFGKHG